MIKKNKKLTKEEIEGNEDLINYSRYLLATSGDGYKEKDDFEKYLEKQLKDPEK